MIIVAGKIKNTAQNVNIIWDSGNINGDAFAIYTLKHLSFIHYGRQTIVPGSNVDNWIADTVGFGMLVIEAFEPGVQITATEGEALAPPPCPDNAVC